MGGRLYEDETVEVVETTETTETTQGE